MDEKEKLAIPFPILVEGKYDKDSILRVARARVYTTDGFGVFKNSEKKALLRALNEKTPILVLTDSDGAGKVIRSHLKGCLPGRLIQLYIPQIPGKEKRKAAPSAEGDLGVEGMADEVLYKILQPYASPDDLPEECSITMADLYNDGFSGSQESSRKRDAAAKTIGLPAGMSANAFLEALRILLSDEDYRAMVGKQQANE